MVLALLMAMLVSALVLLSPAWSQQNQKQGLGGKRGADRSLIGAAVEVQNGENRKNRVDAGDVLKIPVKNLRAAQDATITLRDEDGTQVELVNNKNAAFSTTKQAMSVKVTDETPTEGGDGELSTDSVQIIEEDGVLTIIIGDPNPDEETPDDQYADDQYADDQYAEEQYGGEGQQDDVDCPGAEEVDTVTGTGNKQSPVFNIEGGSFRLTIASDPTSEDPELSSVSVGVSTEDEDLITTFDQNGGGTESSIVNEGPGSFFLDILAANTNYEVIIEDCVEDTGDDGDNSDEAAPDPLPQDDDKGPLVGATGMGKDILVPGDVIGQDPETGEDVVGIDQITISAENCEVVDEEDLTVTLDDQGEPFRVINGVDVDITVDDEGVTINGRETIEGTVNGTEINEPNPDQLIFGFEVEQDDTPEDLSINDMFPVVSTTGIGGEGCSEVADLDTTPDTDTTDDVDTGDDLPNTGGGPADTSTALLFVISGFGLLALRIVKLRRRA